MTMALTPETLPRHELVGLDVRVVESTHAGYVGVAGTVREETTNTLSIELADEADGRTIQVPKSGSTFEFALSPDAAGAETAPEERYVTVDGDRLVARPARRSETRGESPWR